MRITAELLKIGDVNLNGRIYTRETAELMVEQFNQKVAEHGFFFGQLGFGDSADTTTLQRASHNVNEISIRQDRVVGDITIMDTPEGKALKLLVETQMKGYQGVLVEMTNPCGGKVVFRPRSTGTVNEDGTVEIHELISFDAVPVEDDSFKGLLD